MARDGIAQLTTRAICAEAGVHQSVFHYSFKSKKELFEELVRTTVVDMVDAAVLTSEVSNAAGPSIRQGLNSLWEQVQADRDRQLATYELTVSVLRDPELSDLAAWQYQQYVTGGLRYLAAIESAAGIGWALPRELIARLFSASVDGLVLAWLADGDTAATTAAVGTLADFLTSLVVEGTEPAPTRSA